MEHSDQRPCPEPSFHCLLPTYVCLSVGLCTYNYMTVCSLCVPMTAWLMAWSLSWCIKNVLSIFNRVHSLQPPSLLGWFISSFSSMKAWTLQTENNEEKVQKEGRKKEIPKCVSLFSVSRNTRGQATYKQKSFIYFTGLNVHGKDICWACGKGLSAESCHSPGMLKTKTSLLTWFSLSHHKKTH